MNIEVRRSGLHGRGVFATRDLRAGEVIERAPVLVIPRDQVAHLDRTSLYDYYFGWGDDGEDAAIVMGLGSFYNHAVDPNAARVVHHEERAMSFVARRDIAAGDEITLHYNDDPGDLTPLWFQ